MKKVLWKSFKRTMMFVDVSNIYYSQKTLGWEIDYLKLIEFFKTKTTLKKAFFYSGIVSSNNKQQDFFNKMRTFGYDVKTKEVKWIKDKTSKTTKGKGNLDIELALDMVLNASKYDTALLFSGDSDFEPAVLHLKSKGKKTIVLSSRGHISKELIKCSNKYVPFETLKKEISRPKTKSPR